MIHLGDITKINGADVEPVALITFGSPCQDLSIVGKRAGLAGERSGLFMEAVRIIREMRGKTNGGYPTFALWENVVGAFSSNNGDDFRAVLEELARCAEPGICIPGPAKGKWAKAGYIAGDGWSIAWRTFDAQYWGVPQRRRRIAALLDLGGTRAAEILFERQGLSGDPDQSIPAWKGSARDPKKGPAPDDRVLGESGASGDDVICLQGAGATSQNCKDPGYHEGVAYTLNTTDIHGVASAEPLVLNDQGGSQMSVSCGATATLRAQEHGHQPVVFGIGSYASNAWKSANPNSGVYQADVSKTLDAINCGQPGCNQGGMAVCEGPNAVCGTRWIVRRLTPLECERLQGFPDGWTDIGDWTDSKGKVHKGESDSPRYKALGNSIALPQWWWIVCKMAKYLPEGATLASLFDGIGGFPLVWEELHGAGTARWASEIEEFPIAVTKKRFPERDDKT